MTEAKERDKNLADKRRQLRVDCDSMGRRKRRLGDTLGETAEDNGKVKEKGVENEENRKSWGDKTR